MNHSRQSDEKLTLLDRSQSMAYQASKFGSDADAFLAQSIVHMGDCIRELQQQMAALTDQSQYGSSRRR